MPWLSRVPLTVVGGAMIAALIAWFAGMGALSPEALPVYASSRREVIGMALMLIALPPWFVVSSVLSHRHAERMLEQLRPRIPSAAELERAALALRGRGARVWLPGLALGLLMGSLNTSIPEAWRATEAPSIHRAITLGQLLLWSVIGVILAIRFQAKRAFRRLGEIVSFELHQLEALKPLVRSGLADVIVIAGALAFSPLQALDAEFRWYNYQFGLLVAVVAAAVLVLWPLWPIHLRIRDHRDATVAELEAELAALPKPASADEWARLEALLAHRERVRGLGTWLFSTDLVSRFVLYLVIPPLAWIGAAIVERAVDRFLSG